MTRIISVAGFVSLALMAGCKVTSAQQPTGGQNGIPKVAADEFRPWPQNRLRSFYADQARRYLQLDKPIPDVLPAFPGLDGGTFGHWGQAAGKYLMDDSFNRVDYAGMLSTVTGHFGSKTTKAIIVQPGTNGSLSALFDPTRMSFTDVWDGPLVSFSPYMFGLVSPAKPRGRHWLNLRGSKWNVPKTREPEYVGLFRHGRHVVFSYQLGEAKILDHAWKVDGQFARSLHIQGQLAAQSSLTLLETKAKDLRVSKLSGLQMVKFKDEGDSMVVILRCGDDRVRLSVAKRRFVIFGGSNIKLEFAETKVGEPIHLAILRVKDEKVDAAVKAFAEVDLPQLETLTKGGPPRWASKSVVTQGVLGDSGGSYAIDTLTTPGGNKNEFGLPFRVTGVDFLPDGRCVVATLSGDIWLVDGVDAELKILTWKRIAAGLHQPLGVLVQDGKILVAGRDQITRLHDLNGDDEADFYECLTNAYRTSEGHEFITCLREDEKQNLYFSSAVQGIMKYDARDKTVTSLGSGIRYCNGMEVSPDGQTVLATAQEGTWTPATAIFKVGGQSYHGFHGPRSRQGKYGYDLPLCYVPRGIDHSAGGLALLPSDARIGSLAGHFVGLSLGNCTHYLVLREQIGDTVQGGVVPLPGDFLSGAHRIRFNPHDGHVYIGGSSGWQSYAAEQGSLQRLRYTGKPLDFPRAVETYENGLILRFNCRVDPESVQRKNVFCEQWNYLYSPGYGSSEYSARDPGRDGHDAVEVRSLHLLHDGRSVFVEIPQLHPVMQLHLYIQLKSVDKETNKPRDFAPDLYYTVYKMNSDFAAFPGYEKIAKRRFADFPVIRKYPRDRRLVVQEERGRIGAGDLVSRKINAVPGLRFEPSQIRVPPGKRVALTFTNADISMQHNLVVVRKDDLESVGEASMIMAADPRAIARHYVPDDSGVLALSPVLGPGGQYTVYFDAPRRSGVYPIVCTFPGHWQVMRGALIVARKGEKIDVPDDNFGNRRFVKMWKTEDLAADAASLAGRSIDRGRAVFDSAGCIKCHVVVGKGAKLGPDLTEVTKRFQGAKLLEQILNPSSEIHKDYQTHVFMTVDGESVTGLVVREDDDSIQVLPNPLKPEEVTVIQKSNLEERLKSKLSTMPKGLLMTFEKEEILDLLAFLQAGRKTEE